MAFARLLPRALPPLALLGTVAGLVRHARAFDFLCDDAFITLRYAKNLAVLGAPVFNAGERVEGYTSFAWMALLSACLRVGLDEREAVLALGTVAAALLVFATFALWQRAHAGGTAGGLLAAGAVAASAPVAAWTLSGLETPLFAALVTGSVALTARSAERGRRRDGALAGLALGLTTLTRPEGLLVFAICVAALLVARRRVPSGARAAIPFVLAYAATVVPFEIFRIAYYGDPLPNTFYVKAHGGLALLRERGLRYLRFAGEDLGPGLLALTGAALVFPIPRPSEEDDAAARSRFVVVAASRALVVAFVAYVPLVGGDFLELYRFFVPVLPLAFVLIAMTAHAVGERLGRRAPRWAPAAFVAAAAALHAWHDLPWGARARTLAETSHATRGIEPLRWTRAYAVRWAAMGRWLKAHARPGDTLAVGAAGAMPYYSELPTLDLLGLCDREVARSGDDAGSRPGHQKRATRAYTERRRPTFLFDDDRDTDEPKQLDPHDHWGPRGYVWIEAKVGVDDGATKPFYFYFLVDAPRAVELSRAADARLLHALPETPSGSRLVTTKP